MMKKLIAVGALLGLLFTGLANAQSISPGVGIFDSQDLTSIFLTNPSQGGIELTLGGSGEASGSHTGYLGADVGLSYSPWILPIWVGVNQGVWYEGGEDTSDSVLANTDLFLDYSIPLYKEVLFLNPGWSVGVVYGNTKPIWRTGPECWLQYYVGENAFIYGGLNYDINSWGSNGIRYGLGIGIAF
jgi:hypothetical protein